MKKVTLNIPDNKYLFFLELIKNLGLKEVKVKKEEQLVGKERVLQGIREAVEEVNLIKSGKLKAIPAKDLLDEL